jgi:hypothetical protein
VIMIVVNTIHTFVLLRDGNLRFIYPLWVLMIIGLINKDLNLWVHFSVVWATGTCLCEKYTPLPLTWYNMLFIEVLFFHRDKSIYFDGPNGPLWISIPE